MRNVGGSALRELLVRPDYNVRPDVCIRAGLDSSSSDAPAVKVEYAPMGHVVINISGSFRNGSRTGNKNSNQPLKGGGGGE